MHYLWITGGLAQKADECDIVTGFDHFAAEKALVCLEDRPRPDMSDLKNPMELAGAKEVMCWRKATWHGA